MDVERLPPALPFTGPLVTAIVPTYNRPVLCRRAVESVWRQTYTPLELIVVEDASESDLAPWLAAYDGPVPTRYVRREVNGGPAACINTGLALARGEFVSILGDDDEWLPEKMALQIACMRETHPSPDVCYSGLFSVGHGTTSFGRFAIGGNMREYIGTHGLRAIPDSTGLFRRATLERAGGYDADFRSHTEYGVAMRLAAVGAVAAVIPEHLLRVDRTIPGPQMTSSLGPRMESTRAFAAKWHPVWCKWYGEARAAALRRELYQRVFLCYVDFAIDRDWRGVAWRALGREMHRAPIGVADYAEVCWRALRAFVRLTPLQRPLRAMRRRLTGGGESHGERET